MNHGDGGRVGIDRIALSWPARSVELEQQGWATVTTLSPDTPNARQVVGRSIDVEGAQVFVGAAQVEGRWWGKLETNPSRLSDPEGCSLVSVSDFLEDGLPALAAAAAEVVAPAGPVESWRVRRLDVARDFDVLAPGFYVAGLRTVHRPHARRVGVWSSPRHGGAQTLHAGSGAGMVRLYDQYEAYADKGAAPGRMRWEAECRRDWLGRLAGIARVDDLTPDTIGRLSVDRWEWSAMGVEVAATDAVVERVLSAAGRGVMTDRQAQGFIGWLLLEARGLARQPSKATLANYRRWTRDLGITMAPDATAGAFVGRLDWASGQEVLQAA